ncbi:lysylphosphatidylglycerol synthase transmembrane domain-containing protein [Nocardioides sp. R1-1]|uniref:lysylphosphatidylglycerol synthase transmembrane domain-containing protein n=1 Tax=Nocardioides sp. R1-1 TaxID=3383502 RepID=UPI0038D207E0
MSLRRVGTWARWLLPVAILAFLLARCGAEPFLDGLRHTAPGAVVAALLVTAVTTACCARRWSLVATGLGVGVPFAEAYRTCYRAQLLNATLPGGVVGDVHRGYLHGRASGALGRGLRSVVWDRGSGQVVQAALALAVVWLLPGAIRGWVAGALVATLLLAAVALAAARREATAALGPVWPQVLALSVVAAAGHAAVFVVAARTAGVDLAAPRLVALGLVVLLASAIPASIAGWGPREGAAAWAFGACGHGVGTGVEVAVLYGVLSLVATLPGMLVLRAPGTARPSGGTPAKGGAAWSSGPTSS